MMKPHLTALSRWGFVLLAVSRRGWRQPPG
jgi:hypothetical protein